MSDLEKFLKRAEGLVERLEQLLPPAAQAPALTPAEVASVPTVFEIPTPPALAATLFAAELAAVDAAVACLAVDGADAAPAVLEAVPGGVVDVRAASACTGTADEIALEVRGYRTDGSGVGTVECCGR